MTLDARTNITTLQRGDELPSADFAVTAEVAGAYLAATGDTGDYGGCVPPLAVAALALEALQRSLRLPEGSLHTGQEVEHERAVKAGAPLTMRGRVAQRSERQGYVISVIEFEVESPAGTALHARSTIMAPAAAP
jgi:hypothetical protein